MRVTILVIFFLFNQPSRADDVQTNSYRDTLLRLFKSEVNKNIKTGDSKSIVRKELGAPDLIEEKKEYYSLDGFKYRLMVEFSNDKVSKIYYVSKFKKISLKEFKNKIKDFVSTDKNRYIEFRKDKDFIRFYKRSRKLYSFQISGDMEK